MVRWPAKKCQRLATSRENWYAAADAFFLAGGLSETSLTGQLYRDNGIERAKEACVKLGSIKGDNGLINPRLLGVEGLAPAFAWPREIPSVVPERLTGQLHGGVCLEAKTSAERVGSSRCTKPLAVHARRRRRRDRSRSQGHGVRQKKSRNKNRFKTDAAQTRNPFDASQPFYGRWSFDQASKKKRRLTPMCMLTGSHFTLAVCACVCWKLGANKPKEALRDALAGLRIQGLKPSGSEKPLLSCCCQQAPRGLCHSVHYGHIVGNIGPVSVSAKYYTIVPTYFRRGTKRLRGALGRVHVVSAISSTSSVKLQEVPEKRFDSMRQGYKNPAGERKKKNCTSFPLPSLPAISHLQIY